MKSMGIKALLALVLLSQGALAAKKKNFVYCSEGSPSTFNPQLGTDGPTFNASSRMIYDRLVEFEPGGTKIVPGLAESWEVSPDGKTYTFQLRKDVSFQSRGDFQPTRKFGADDVLFSFRRMMDKSHSYHRVGGGNYEYFKSMSMGDLIRKIETPNSRTVRFLLKKKEAPFLANMAMDFASILSAEYGLHLEKKNKKSLIDQEPVGTGPFVLKRYMKDNLIRYEAFQSYFRGPAKLDKVVFSIVQDPSVRFQKLKVGECDLIAEPAPQDLAQLRKMKSIQVLEAPGLNVGYLAMNVEKPPLDKLLVRQAINHALNKANYIEAIYKSQALMAKNPIPPTMWSYDKTTVDYSYNIEKAKELLKKAGLAKGFEITLWTLPVSRPYNPNGKKMGELIQSDLAKIGIRVKLETYDWPTYLSKARKGEHQLIQLGWTGDNGDPDNFLNVLLGCASVKSGSNVARWCNKNFEKLVSQARETSDVKKRTQLYKKAQVEFRKESPWVTLAHARVFRSFSTRVMNYKISPFGTENFYSLDVKTK